MRVERLDLVSYGHLRDVSLDLSVPPGGLGLVLGPNEAGKSTTLRALTALLFGVGRASPDHYGRGRESLRIGARLVGADGAPVELVRQGLSRQPLVDADGRAVDEGVVRTLLGGADRALFTSLFRIDHDELHARSKELLDTEGELGRLVFGASLGATSLGDLLASLDARADRLFRPRGTTQEVNQALSRYRSCQREAKDLRTRSREWERRRNAVQDAEAEVARLRGLLADGRAAQAELGRLRAAMPQLALRRHALGRLDELTAAGPLQTAAWAARTRSLWDELERAVGRRDDAAAAVERLGADLDAIDVPGLLLAAADRVDQLVAGLERHRKDTADLPRLKGELAAADATLTSATGRLGLNLAETAAVTEAQLAEIERLAAAHAGVATAEQAAEDELRTAENELARIADELKELPPPTDVEDLRQVVEEAAPLVPRDDDVAAERVAVRQLGGDLLAARRRAGLGSGVDVESLALPTLRAVQEAMEHRRVLTSHVDHQDRRVEELDRRLDALAEERSRVATTPGLPEPEALAIARQRRDQRWQAVRTAWLGAGEDPRSNSRPPADLAESFEAASATADAAADARYEHAAQIERLGELERQHRDAAEERWRARKELETRRDDLAAADAAWASMWRTARLEPADPNSASERLAELTELQQAAVGLRRRTAALEVAEERLFRLAGLLAGELRSLGVQPSHDRLTPLLGQARALVAAADEQATERARMVERQAQASRVHGARHAGRRRAAQAARRWAQSWGAGVAAIGLDGGTDPDTARAAAAEVRRAHGAILQTEALRRRVRGLERDIEEFAAPAQRLLEELAPDLAGSGLLGSLEILRRRLEAGRAADARRQALSDELAGARQRHAAAATRADELAASLAAQRRAAGLDESGPLDDHLTRAEEAAALVDRAREAEATVLEQGGGATVDVVVVAAEAFADDPFRVDAALEAADTRILDLERSFGEASEHLSATRRSLAEVDGSGGAAAAEQAAEVELAGLASAVGSYAHAALAREVLRRVMADYAREHRAPLVDRASETFSILTGEAFRELVVDAEGATQRLLARRADGQVHPLHELSDGTVDQLYLSLRLAAVEHHLDRATEPLPVVLDDLLVNFDDGRAAAALEALAHLGRRTQVLLFTHHPHMVDLARRTLGACRLSVSELAPRPHDAPGVHHQPAPARPSGSVPVP